MSGTAAFRSITSNVKKITLFIALRACVRRNYGGDEKSAFRAFPKSLAAFRTYILFEFPVSGIATKSAYHFILLAFHFLHLLADWFLWEILGRMKFTYPQLIRCSIRDVDHQANYSFQSLTYREPYSGQSR